MIYTYNYRIGLEDIGKNNKATNKAILGIMEDIAGLHSADVGYGVLDMEEKQKAWLLLDWKLEVIKRPLYNDEIKAETWSRKVEKITAYRDFRLKDKDNNIIAIGTSRWLFINTLRKRPLRITDEIADLYKTEENLKVFENEIDDVLESETILEKDYTVLRRDIDLNNHMHNLSYLDLAYEVIPAEIYENISFNNVRITYKKEIFLDDVVKCYYSKCNNKHIITVKKDDNINSVIELY